MQPLPHAFPGPVPSSHPSSRVFTPPGRQQPSGMGLVTMDYFVLLARVGPIPSPFPADMLRSPAQPQMIQSGASRHISHV